MPPATAGHPGDRPGVAALYAFPVAPLTRRASPATRSALADRVAPTFSAGWLADSSLETLHDAHSFAVSPLLRHREHARVLPSPSTRTYRARTQA